MTSSERIQSNLLGAVGAVIGGTLGFFLFGWFAEKGYYGLMIPGGLLGYGCGLLSRHRSDMRGIACGLAAFVIGIYTEFWNFPFTKDESLGYFVRNLGSLNPVTWIMLVFGSLAAYYLGRTVGRTKPMDE